MTDQIISDAFGEEPKVIRIKPLPSVSSFNITYHFDAEGRHIIETLKRILTYSQFTSSDDELANKKDDRILAASICDSILHPIFYFSAKRDAEELVYRRKKIPLFSSYFRLLFTTALVETSNDNPEVHVPIIELFKEMRLQFITDFSMRLKEVVSTTDVVRAKKDYWKHILFELGEQGISKQYLERVYLIFECYVESYAVTLWDEEQPAVN